MPGASRVEIHDQHVAPALGLVRRENRHGTGPADAALDTVKRQNRRDAGKWRPPAGSPILAHDTPVDDGNPPPCGIGTWGLRRRPVPARRYRQRVTDRAGRQRRRPPGQWRSSPGHLWIRCRGFAPSRVWPDARSRNVSLPSTSLTNRWSSSACSPNWVLTSRANVLSALSKVTVPSPESAITVSRCSPHS